jgi:hypothetical protein
MPVSMSQLLTNTATVSFEYSGFSIAVTYLPAEITEEVFANLQVFMSMNNYTEVMSGFKSLNDIIALLVKSWDLYEDDAQTEMVSLTAERLAKLPVALRVQCLFAIMRDFRPEALMPQTQS